MKINNTLFPYPVLSDIGDDYIDSKFEIEYELIDKGFRTKALRVKFNLENEEIEKHIKEGNMIFSLHVECSLTSYRKLYPVYTEEFILNLDEDYFRDKVEVNGFIVSNKKMDIYTNKNINTDYYGENYKLRKLEKGNIIGATLTQEVVIKTENYDMEDIPSIIKVGKSKDKFMDINMDGDTIIIKLPEKEYKSYVNLSGTIYSDIIMTSTILPGLIYVLDALGGSGPIDVNLSWVKVMADKLASKDIEFDDINEKYSSLELAQMILESPIERAFEKLETEVERDEI